MPEIDPRRKRNGPKLVAVRIHVSRCVSIALSDTEITTLTCRSVYAAVPENFKPNLRLFTRMIELYCLREGRLK